MLTLRKRVTRRVAAISAVTLGTVGLAATPASSTQIDDKVTIDIAAITDFHGHIENAGALAYQLNVIRAENPDTIFVSNGDNVGGSAYVSSIANDDPTMDILNKMGLQVSSTGNHEYDKGYADLRDRIAPATNWGWSVANLDGVDPAVAPPYQIIDQAGVRVAFIGSVTDDLYTLVSPTGIQGLTVSDPVAATDTYAAMLKDGNPENGEADIVVALMHADQSVASRVGPNVDAVVAGHTHIEANLTTASGAPVVEPGSFGTLLGRITLTYNKTDRSITVDFAGNIPIKAANGEDAEIAALFAAAQAHASELGQQQIGTIKGVANRGTNDGTNNGANRGTESSVGNLLAEGFYRYGQGMGKSVDFGIINPGGLRADLDPNGDGIITLEESYTVQPFGNTFATVELTGAQVYTMLEQQWNPDQTAARPILRLGLSYNFNYVYDPAAPVGSKVTSVRIDEEVVPRDDSKVYTVASNQFLLAGGDGFTVFSDPEVASTYSDTGLIDNDVFNDFLRANPDFEVSYTQRSVGVTGPTEVVAGSKFTYEISSLIMTSTEPDKPTEVLVAIGPGLLGSADIDPTITPNRDESGKATVEVAIPYNIDAGSLWLAVYAGDIRTPAAHFQVNVSVPTAHPNTFVLPDGYLASWVDFGRADDIPLVGDWDGDKVDTVAVKRGNRYYLRNDHTSGPATEVFAYGRADDIPLVGDWDGDGIDTISVLRGNRLYVKNSLAGGAADYSVAFGRNTDTFIAGDWDGDGVDTLAAKRGNVYYLKNSLTAGVADEQFVLGEPDDLAFAGRWYDFLEADTVAVLRPGDEGFYKTAILVNGAPWTDLVAIGHDKQIVAGKFSAGALDTFAFRG